MVPTYPVSTSMGHAQMPTPPLYDYSAHKIGDQAALLVTASTGAKRKAVVLADPELKPHEPWSTVGPESNLRKLARARQTARLAMHLSPMSA
jgi:hypothetical protein